MLAGYDFEPIGVDGKLEATTVHWFCSEVCAGAAGYEAHLNPDAIDGTDCDHCHQPLEA